MCCCEQRAWTALRLPGGGPSALLGPILSILLTQGEACGFSGSRAPAVASPHAFSRARYLLPAWAVVLRLFWSLRPHAWGLKASHWAAAGGQSLGVWSRPGGRGRSVCLWVLGTPGMLTS